MKNKLLFILLISGFWSCKEKGDCTSTRTTLVNTPVIHPFSEIRDSVRFLPAREMEDPGKILVKGTILFVSEIKKGVHIIENSDPTNPVFLSFLQIPGNGDLAIYQNRLYADSYSDLISFDITNLNDIKEVERAQQVFKSGWFNGKWWSVQDGGLYFGEKIEKYVTEIVNCDEPEDLIAIEDPAPISALEHAKTAPRFAVQDKYLYTINREVLDIFDLDKTPKLKAINSASIGSVNFSFTSFQNKLILDYNYYMWIFDNTNPLTTRMISILDSMSMCDKVVVQNDIAYVSERTGTICGGNQNRLKLFDISDAAHPRFMKKCPMDSPRALSIDFPILYICEGINGFKVFDVSDTAAIDQHLLSHEKDIQANNVFVSGKTVIITAADGLYQLDATDPKNLRRLSKITFKKG
ncbi:LVIVD repeat-containing protein [Dyadobacter sp. 3J3]|uniref:LVIVD repeat-containing protein n=1 Tax=Dyadobacter sp. 3J3 TaxID=2606600 RepID=UPI00135C7A21|nr:hypothetical protein [Dyadobacter sp. 3J3]